MSQLENELKQLIIDVLNLEEVGIDDIDSQAPLFGDGLGLDSIDALELGIALKKKYDIVIDSDNSETLKHFVSVHQLAVFIESQKGK
jgi:acyl carrier protein